MSVASHLGISVREYDRRIRTFIPNYAEMLDEVASAVDPAAETIVDLGVGTGGLSARCLRRAPAARVIGIDADAEMLPLAQRRLGRRATLKVGNFLRTELPRADAVVATLMPPANIRASANALPHRFTPASARRAVSLQ